MAISRFIDSFLVVWVRIFPYFINLLLAAFVLIAGISAARLVQYLVTFFFKNIGIDCFLEKIKLTAFLEKAEIKRPVSQLLGDISYWLAVLLLIVALANFLGLPVDPLLDRILNYIGIVFLAALVLGLGVFLSSFISGVVYIIAVNVGIPGAKTIARIMQYATIIFAFLLALEQLGIGPSLIVPSIGVIIGAVGLAVAIAFGLGCKDIMADFVSNLIKGK
ncbi:MAG: hypothetical protein HQ564_04895 [Candidatus Saganbacteria bacterium]|nr:hypothetical protein [Candidatus Saganbacteria bacterium]